jgi:septum formation protein
VVVIDGIVLGKPLDDADARCMLARLSGRWHEVLTAVALIGPDAAVLDELVVASQVEFGPLTGDEIDAYVATGEPVDKAGAYAIQGLGARFVEEINGCYFNVVGLPVSRLYQMMKRLGSDVSWKQRS